MVSLDAFPVSPAPSSGAMKYVLEAAGYRGKAPAGTGLAGWADAERAATDMKKAKPSARSGGPARSPSVSSRIGAAGSGQFLKTLLVQVAEDDSAGGHGTRS